MVKVISGVRGCGKTTLMHQFMDELRSNWVPEDQIIYIDFESKKAQQLLDSTNLHEYIMANTIPDEKMIVILDEIDRVYEFEKVVNSLLAKKNYDVYVVMSSDYLHTSKEALAILDKSVNIKVLPYSFQEYIEINQDSDKYKEFKKYMHMGGFPSVLMCKNSSKHTNTMLSYIYGDALSEYVLKNLEKKWDGVDADNADDGMLLQALSYSLTKLTSEPITTNRLTTFIRDNGYRCSTTSVTNHLASLIDAFIFFPVEKIDVASKKVLTTKKKYYAVDTSLARVLGNAGNGVSEEYLLRDIVYLELRRKGYKVFFGKNGKHEIDFVAKKNWEYAYYQVRGKIMAEEIFQEEIDALARIKDAYPKTILTLDMFATGNYQGIKVVNVVDWLLEK